MELALMAALFHINTEKLPAETSVIILVLLDGTCIGIAPVFLLVLLLSHQFIKAPNTIASPLVQLINTFTITKLVKTLVFFL